MSVDKDIIDLIPLLVQGKLNVTERDRVLEQIRQSPELQKEYDLWQGIYAIRHQMPRFDSSAHLSPELLDRFAQGRISQLSAEYSEIASHLHKCAACTSDIELLKQALKQLPEDRPVQAAAERSAWLRAIFGLRAPTIKALAPVFSFLVIVIGLFLVLQHNRQTGDIATIVLKPQFEKRSVTNQAHVPEMPVFLQKQTSKVVFSFATDRIDIPNYHYLISLAPKGGPAVKLNAGDVLCHESQLTNECDLTVTDSNVLNRLKQGGSFALSIKEEFPAGVQLEPAEYEYYFKVSVR